MRNQTIEGNVAFGRFGHSVTSLGDLNNDGCDGQYVHTIIMCVVFISVCVCVCVCMCVCVFLILQILQSVLHLMTMEKYLFTMDLKVVG